MLPHTRHPALRLAVVAGTLGGFLLLTACASQFQTTYKPAPASHRLLVAAPTAPELRWSDNLDRDGKQLVQQGYVMVGTSQHLYADVDQASQQAVEQEAVAQGSKVGAAVVLLYAEVATFEDDPGCANDPRLSCDPAFDHSVANYAASYWAKAAPTGG